MTESLETKWMIDREGRVSLAQLAERIFANRFDAKNLKSSSFDIIRRFKPAKDLSKTNFTGSKTSVVDKQQIEEILEAMAQKKNYKKYVEEFRSSRLFSDLMNRMENVGSCTDSDVQFHAPYNWMICHGEYVSLKQVLSVIYEKNGGNRKVQKIRRFLQIRGLVDNLKRSRFMQRVFVVVNVDQLLEVLDTIEKDSLNDDGWIIDKFRKSDVFEDLKEILSGDNRSMMSWISVLNNPNERTEKLIKWLWDEHGKDISKFLKMDVVLETCRKQLTEQIDRAIYEGDDKSKILKMLEFLNIPCCTTTDCVKSLHPNIIPRGDKTSVFEFLVHYAREWPTWFPGFLDLMCNSFMEWSGGAFEFCDECYSLMYFPTETVRVVDDVHRYDFGSFEIKHAIDWKMANLLQSKYMWEVIIKPHFGENFWKPNSLLTLPEPDEMFHYHFEQMLEIILVRLDQSPVRTLDIMFNQFEKTRSKFMSDFPCTFSMVDDIVNLHTKTAKRIRRF